MNVWTDFLILDLKKSHLIVILSWPSTFSFEFLTRHNVPCPDRVVNCVGEVWDL